MLPLAIKNNLSSLDNTAKLLLTAKYLVQINFTFALTVQQNLNPILLIFV